MFIRTALYFCGGFVGTNKGVRVRANPYAFGKKGEDKNNVGLKNIK